MATIADRDLNKLVEPFKTKAHLFLKEAKGIFVTETWRSQKRQTELIDKGLSKIKISRHQLGEAIDIAFNGSELYPKDHSKREKIAKIARKYEMDWGYDLWKRDKPHFQCNRKEIRTPSGLINMGYLPKLYKQDDKIVQYNQTKKDCSDYASTGAISDLYNRKLSESELENLQTFLSSKGMTKEKGDSMYIVAPLVCERWRMKFGEQGELPFAHIIDLNSKDANNLLLKGYSIMISRKTNKDIVKDWIDGVFSGIFNGYSISSKHATRVKIMGGNLYEINNKYGKRENNIAEYRNWATHIRTGTINRYGVVFM